MLTVALLIPIDMYTRTESLSVFKRLHTVHTLKDSTKDSTGDPTRDSK